MASLSYPPLVPRGLSSKGCGRSNSQLHSFNYYVDIPGKVNKCRLVEVQFKNTRKGYFLNTNGLRLQKGDVVAVEAMPGHDVGTVTLTGRLVPLQMAKINFPASEELKRVYRHAKPYDLEKLEEAKAREHETMIKARQIAKELELKMKIGDVEFQGDGQKAIFYYIADARVDFRKLIKVLADAFKVRIEMKQIGARQEAGRIGGIGPCGRELCCAAWMKNFSTVSTAAARVQDITPNPQKLAGQCAKLKCCLNYETDVYMEAGRKLPERNVPLETADGTFYHFKADILAGRVTYSSDRRMPANLTEISAARAREIIEMNRRGERPVSLTGVVPPEADLADLAEQDELTRFDRSKGGRRRRKASAEKQAERNAQNAAAAARLEEGGNAAHGAERGTAKAESRGDGRNERRNGEARGEAARRNGNNRRRQQRSNGAAGGANDEQGARRRGRDEAKR